MSPSDRSASLHIPAEEIRAHSLSHSDPGGRLFSWRGELYRGIPAANAEFTRRLFAEGIVPKLTDRGLVIPTELTELRADGFPLVLRHATVPFVSYPFEWNGEMLRDAARHTLAVIAELAPHGLVLKDAHGWNVLFDGPRPTFVDFGSIIAAGPDAWRFEREFSESFLHPLAFMARGHARVARRLLQDFERGVDLEEFALVNRFSTSVAMRRSLRSLKEAAKRRLPATMLKRLGEQYRQLKRTSAVQSVKAMQFARLQDRLQAIRLPAGTTKWSGYYDEGLPPLVPDASWNAKHRAIHGLLERFRPGSVLDIGANRGWYSMLAAKNGAKAIALDTDEVCLNQLHLDVKRQGLDVQALVMSFSQPTPRLGLGDGIVHSATDRLGCELVLGLALAHHMVFSAQLSFAQIAAGFSSFAKKVLVVEFVPHNDEHVRKWMSDRYAWYTLENFVGALSRHFRTITRMPSYPDPRVLLVCER